jgi:hypothetical protein
MRLRLDDPFAYNRTDLWDALDGWKVAVESCSKAAGGRSSCSSLQRGCCPERNEVSECASQVSSLVHLRLPSVVLAKFPV